MCRSEGRDLNIALVGVAQLDNSWRVQALLAAAESGGQL
jgi:hypothetical protein